MAGLTQLHGLVDAAAGRAPDDLALLEGSRERTYRELSDRMWKLAGALRDLGLAPGDRVAGWLPPGGDEVLGCLAVSAAGGVYVPIHSRLKGEQVRHILVDCQAQMLVTQGTRLEAVAKLASHLPDLKCVLGAGRSATNSLRQAQAVLPVISMSEVRASANSADKAPVRTAQDPALLLYTGVANGPPVAMPMTHDDLVKRAECRRAKLDLVPSDAVLSLVDLSVRPGVEIFVGALAAGAQLLPTIPHGPEELLTSMEDRRVTVLAADRSDWAALLDLDWAADAFPDLRRIIICGRALTKEQTAELQWRLPQAVGKILAHPRYQKGVIVTGGYPVGPADVEAPFWGTGLVETVVATGVPDPLLGQRIRVVCQLRDLDGAERAMDADKLKRMVARTLPEFMLPSEIKVRSTG